MGNEAIIGILPLVVGCGFLERTTQKWSNDPQVKPKSIVFRWELCGHWN